MHLYNYSALGASLLDKVGVKRSRFALCMGWTAQVTTCDQHSLADSSINYTAAEHVYVLSTLGPSGLSLL